MRPRRRVVRVVGVLLVGALSPRMAWAVDEATVRSWLEGEIERAAEWPDLQGVAWAFSYDVYSSRPASEIERLRAEVRNRPDHPERARVAAYDTMRASGPQRTEYVLRFESPEKWRLNSDRRGGADYFDVAFTKTSAWSMTVDQLCLIDPRKGWPEGRRLDSMVSEARNAAMFLIRGGLPVGQDVAWTVERVEQEGQDWAAEITINGERRRLRGLLDQALGQPIVSANESVSPDGRTLSRLEFDGWERDGALGLVRASSATLLHADGSEFFRYSHVRADIEPEEDLARAVVAPRFDSTDLLRGPVTATSVLDYSGTLPEALVREADGLTLAIPLALPSAQRPLAWLRIVGWGLGGLSVVLVVAAVRRRWGAGSSQ